MSESADKFFQWESRESIPQNRVIGEAETLEQVPGALESFMKDPEIPPEVKEKFKERIDFHTEGGKLKIHSFKVAKSGENHKGWLSIDAGKDALYEPGGFILEEGLPGEGEDGEYDV